MVSKINLDPNSVFFFAHDGTVPEELLRLNGRNEHPDAEEIGGRQFQPLLGRSGPSDRSGSKPTGRAAKGSLHFTTKKWL